MSLNGHTHAGQDETSKILAANAAYAENFSDELSKLPMPPGRKIALVVCMDAVGSPPHVAPYHSPLSRHSLFPSSPIPLSLSQRLETGRLAGLKEGDAHVIRNAGGRVHDALRSLAISQQLLGTEEVAIIHHTDCGMLTFKDSDLQQRFKAQGLDADHVAFLTFTDVAQSVKDDIKVYQASPLVRHDVPVRGFIYDVHSGKLEEVKA